NCPVRQIEEKILQNQCENKEVVGPEGLLNSNNFNSLVQFGTENRFYGNQWFSKSLVPLFPAVSDPLFPLVLRPGRRA
ncbi:hypothetical protein JZX87_30320, partial [Agrobacterium sp. Ap1]|uniref:hypothetical protein n=1 Tax=Agrobacterium sp. Ap1 TaxID=2815337 RepID=UPI001A8F6E81